MTQLGGEELSRSFLSLVETGRSRVSLRALAIIADRLELPISHFLEEADKTKAAELVLDLAAAAIARQEPGEALRRLDEAVTPEALRHRALFLRGTALLNDGRAREAVPILQEAAERLQEHPDKMQLTRVCYTLGAATYALHSYEEALTYFRCAWDEAQHGPQNPVMLGRICVSIGHILHAQGDVDGALAHYSRAREFFGPLRDPSTLAGIYSALSLVHERSGNLAEAVHYSKLSLGVYEATADARRAAVELNNMAVHYRGLHDLDNAHSCVQEAIERARELHAPEVEALARSTLASIYLEQGDTDAAAREAQAVVDMPVERPALAQADARIVLAKLAEQRNDLAASDDHFQRGLAVLEQSGDHRRYVDAARAYGLLLRRRGELDKALEFVLKATEPPAPDKL